MAYTTIDKPSDYFNTKLYTGTGSSNAITGVGFQPDLTWIKSRSVAGAGHRWHDSVRGAGNMIASDSAAAEFDDSALFTSFDTDGFTVAGTGSSYNGSSSTYASWNWLAGGTASSNTDGSITSSVSANTTAGFSIVSYTGTGSAATVGHGLGATPAFVVYKKRSATGSWIVYHHKNTSAPETDYLSLNSTNGTQDAATAWNDTAPTSSVFSVGTAGSGSSATYIAYCFAEKKGYSKFGSYTGNGNADGTFVYTGFKPAFVLNKLISGTTANWSIVDNKRDNNFNPNVRLFPDLSNAESSTDAVDLLSNGFKWRLTSDTNNGNYSYIYMAFAENPFVTSTGIPTTAR